MDDEEDGDDEWMQFLEGGPPKADEAQDEAPAQDVEVANEDQETGEDADGVAEEGQEAEMEEAEVEMEVEEAADEEVVAEEAMTEEAVAEEAEAGAEVAEPATEFVEIEDGGEEEEEEAGEQPEEEEEVDVEIEEMEAAAEEAMSSKPKAGAEFRDALEELSEGEDAKPKVKVQATAKASAKASAKDKDVAEAPVTKEKVAAQNGETPRRPATPGTADLPRYKPQPGTSPSKGAALKGKGKAKGATAVGAAGVQRPLTPGVHPVGKGSQAKGSQPKGKAKGGKGATGLAVRANGASAATAAYPGRVQGAKGEKTHSGGKSASSGKGNRASGIANAPWNSSGRATTATKADWKEKDEWTEEIDWNMSGTVKSTSGKGKDKSGKGKDSSSKGKDNSGKGKQGSAGSHHKLHHVRLQTHRREKGSDGGSPKGAGKAEGKSSKDGKTGKAGKAGKTGERPKGKGKFDGASTASAAEEEVPAAAPSEPGKISKGTAIVVKKNSPIYTDIENFKKLRTAEEGEQLIASGKPKKTLAPNGVDIVTLVPVQPEGAIHKQRVVEASQAAEKGIKRKPSTDGTPLVGVKKKPKVQQLAALDAEGRRYDLEHVVVNFANVGAYYSIKVLKAENSLFDWEGVRRCVRHLTQEVGLKVIGVLFENFNAPDNGSRQRREMPPDIRRMCAAIQETPRIQGANQKSADDEMTIKCAYRRNCRFMDNDNYRDWKEQIRDEKCREWLNKCQDLLQMRYYFDHTLGTFDTLDGNVPVGLLADGHKISATKSELWGKGDKRGKR